MKKVILSFAIALTTATGAFAQKQEGGEKNLEVQFSPLSNGASPIGLNGIRLRLFNGDGTGAIRIGLNLGGSSVETVNTQPYSQTYLNQNNQTASRDFEALLDIEKAFNFTIRPGYEIHFEGTDRLSPYVGAEIIFGMGSETLTREFYGADKAENANRVDLLQKWEAERKLKTSTFGINAVAGVDYYIADHLYLGAELGFGFQSKRYKDAEVTLASNNYFVYTEAAREDSDFSDYVEIKTVDGVEQANIKTVVGDGKGKSKESGWGPNYVATIRLGWLF